MTDMHSWLTAYRPDLLDRGVPALAQNPKSARIKVSATALRAEAGAMPAERHTMMRFSELRYGERVMIYAEIGEDYLLQNEDGYVGFVAAADCGADFTPTHKISVPITIAQKDAHARGVFCERLTLGSEVAVKKMHDRYAELHDGSFVLASHVWDIAHVEPDFVFTAGRLLHAPYMLGGRTPLGMDCSAFVQLALKLSGISAPRDTDMQEKNLGVGVDQVAPHFHYQRYDLVFFKGHVVIMTNATHAINATAHHGLVIVETLADLIARYGAPTAVRRLS